MGGLGRHAILWIKKRKEYLKNNPPNFQGYYICYLCHKWVPANEITVDHIIPRSRAPYLRYEDSNLAPCCDPCNKKKASRVVNDQTIDYLQRDFIDDL